VGKKGRKKMMHKRNGNQIPAKGSPLDAGNSKWTGKKSARGKGEAPAKLGSEKMKEVGRGQHKQIISQGEKEKKKLGVSHPGGDVGLACIKGDWLLRGGKKVIWDAVGKKRKIRFQRSRVVFVKRRENPFQRKRVAKCRN